MKLEQLTAADLRALRNDPNVGAALKEKIDALGINDIKKYQKSIDFGRTWRLTVPWSCLASDNRRKGVIGKESQEATAGYKMALVRFRNHVGEGYSELPTHGPVALEALFYFPDDRVRDPSNFMKLVLDGLKGIVITDDRWQVLRRVVFEAGGIDVDRPRCELTLTPFTQVAQ